MIWSDLVTTKVVKFANSFMNYILELGHDFSATEVNSKNKSVTSLFPALSEIITEKQALDLEQKLSKKEDETKKTKFKI
jgi:hypothetical protein